MGLRALWVVVIAEMLVGLIWAEDLLVFLGHW